MFWHSIVVSYFPIILKVSHQSPSPVPHIQSFKCNFIAVFLNMSKPLYITRDLRKDYKLKETKISNRGKKQIPKEINISKNTMKYKNTSITPREIQDNSTSIKQVQDAIRKDNMNGYLEILKCDWQRNVGLSWWSSG